MTQRLVAVGLLVIAVNGFMFVGYKLGKASVKPTTLTVTKDREVIKRVPEIHEVRVAGPVTTITRRERVLIPGPNGPECKETTIIEKVQAPVSTQKDSKGGLIASKEQSTTVVRTTELLRWSLEARGAVDLNFKPRFESLAVGLRVLGPVWVTAGASVPTKALVVGVKVTW